MAAPARFAAPDRPAEPADGPAATTAAPAVNQRQARALGSPLRLTVTLAIGRAGESVAARGSDASGGVGRGDGSREADLAEAARVDAAWLAVIRTFEAVDQAMSRFRDDSEITALNRRSPEARKGVSRMLARALVAADRAVRVTAGRFDPRIVDALDRIGYLGAPIARRPAPPPGEPVPARILVRDGRSDSIALPVPVDLGGIGKGLALRWAAQEAEAVLGLGGFLLEAGGDIVAAGPAPDGRPWRVGIEDPAGEAGPLAVLEIAGRAAVCTSSIRRLRWMQGGREVHHLIDPRTGEPADSGLAAVTVSGPDPAWAEVWSKALFLDGAARIADEARRRGLAAWWATTDGRLEMSPAARMRTIWVAAEAGRAQGTGRA